MKLFVCISLALIAAVTAGHSYGSANPSTYGAAPALSSYESGSSASAVQQVSLAGLTNLVDVGAIERYLNAPAPSQHGRNSASYAAAKYVVAPSAPSAGPVISSSYSAAPAPAAASHGAAPAAYGAAPATYAAAPAPITYASAVPSVSYGQPAPLPSYGSAAVSSGGYAASAAPKYEVLPAYVSQINAGKNNYKTYQTPIQYSTVTLPVAPAGPVANLYVPENAGSGSSGYSSSGSSYGGASY
ncbi:PREDICTED: chorion protein S19 [Rhagoletis zephyria]|uniref:chorion protein S19 n=1 Tax=Rhagoletis zephyria TaxID=28612 RepID=UPI00081172D7|nr:PREDICTED: chorion protein S19 [Rhagoletis zephyria]